MQASLRNQFNELVNAAKKAAGGDAAWAGLTVPQRNQAIYAVMRERDARAASHSADLPSNPPPIRPTPP